MKIPARIHVLLAPKSSQALIIRRGPSKHTAVIGWNRSDDSFAVGQWIKGKVYHYRSDISQDGRHWIYFAMDAHGQTWTAIAKAPYLKALGFYPKGDAWNGGGLFVTDRSYWLNDAGPTKYQCVRNTSGLSICPQWQEQSNQQGECPGIYFLQLERDGWTKAETVQSDKFEHTVKFYKPINDNWQLWKMFHAGLNHPIGKSPYYESHILRHSRSGNEIELPDAEWAEIDRNRFLWAEQGKIMSGYVSKNGLRDQMVLLDTNILKFTELMAPY